MDRYVNSCGGSLSLRKGTIIVPFVASQYDRVHLNKDGKRKIASVHRLVAIAFVENPCPEKFKEVNHIDEDKTNNNANNLEWCDRSYNQKYYAERHPEEKVRIFIGKSIIINAEQSTSVQYVGKLHIIKNAVLLSAELKKHKELIDLIDKN